MCLHVVALCFLIKPGGIARGMMIIIEPDNNSQQMDHKKWYTCGLASRQVSVLALCYLIKLDGIVRGMMDGDYIVFKILFIVYTHQFNDP